MYPTLLAKNLINRFWGLSIGPIKGYTNMYIMVIIRHCAIINTALMGRRNIKPRANLTDPKKLNRGTSNASTAFVFILRPQMSISSELASRDSNRLYLPVVPC